MILFVRTRLTILGERDWKKREYLEGPANKNIVQQTLYTTHGEVLHHKMSPLIGGRSKLRKQFELFRNHDLKR